MEVAMRGSKPECVVLSAAARVILEQLERCYIGQQIALRACIILDAADGRNNSQIARDLNISLDMVRLWRRRWIARAASNLDEPAILDCLTDAPRSGRPTSSLREREVAGHQVLV
jgi:hypothetical protein